MERPHDFLRIFQQIQRHNKSNNSQVRLAFGSRLLRAAAAPGFWGLLLLLT